MSAIIINATFLKKTFWAMHQFSTGNTDDFNSIVEETKKDKKNKKK